METGEFLALLVTLGILFIGLPWLIFHYITKWKTAATLSSGDEKLLDELHDMARRLDDRICSIERIMTAENPNWRQQCLPEPTRSLESTSDIDHELSTIRRNTPTREYR
jgi:phage shock protein B